MTNVPCVSLLLLLFDVTLYTFLYCLHSSFLSIFGENRPRCSDRSLAPERAEIEQERLDASCLKKPHCNCVALLGLGTQEI